MLCMNTVLYLILHPTHTNCKKYVSRKWLVKKQGEKRQVLHIELIESNSTSNTGTQHRNWVTRVRDINSSGVSHCISFWGNKGCQLRVCLERGALTINIILTSILDANWTGAFPNQWGAGGAVSQPSPGFDSSWSFLEFVLNIVPSLLLTHRLNSKPFFPLPTPAGSLFYKLRRSWDHVSLQPKSGDFSSSFSSRHRLETHKVKDL